MLEQPIWIGSQDDVAIGPGAESKLKLENDFRYATANGILRVDEERWRQAQKFEHDCWMVHAQHAASDRQDEHKAAFADYACLPHNLGDVLEIGCGPFTQVMTILSGRTCKSLRLQDPLINEYRQHPNCPYANLVLGGVPVVTHAMKAEDLTLEGTQDLVVMINVLEHVLDAPMVLDAIERALRPGGILVLHERTWEATSPLRLYDRGHPIRIHPEALGRFRPWEVMHELIRPHEGGLEFYLIVKKP